MIATRSATSYSTGFELADVGHGREASDVSKATSSSCWECLAAWRGEGGATVVIDLSGGLPAEREFVFAEQPSDPAMRESVNAWVWDDNGAFGMPVL